MAVNNEELSDGQRYFDAEDWVINRGMRSSFILKAGMSHSDVVDLKIRLNWLGYGKSKTTKKFGEFFKKQIIRFQKNHDLPANGLVDEMTRQKVAAVFAYFHHPQSEHCQTKTLINMFQNLGFDREVSDQPAYQDLENRIVRFQRFYDIEDIGFLDCDTLHKLNDLLRSPLQPGEEHKDVVRLKRELNRLGYGKIKQTSKFGSLTKKKVMKFQDHYGLPISGIADDLTLNKIEQARKVGEKVTYINYDVTLSEVLDQKKNNTKADKAELESVLNPNSHVNDAKKKFLFLDLFKTDVVSASALNQFLEGKGVLEGTESAFINAGKQLGINELFLLAHALQDTGQGFFPKCTEAPVDTDGNVTYTEMYANGETARIPGITAETKNVVYDIYGLSETVEYDHIKTAVDNGWVTLSQAVSGGAGQIKSNYSSADNTLYKMFCNPSGFSRNNELEPSADFDWIMAAMEELHNIYQALETYTLYLEIPVYKDQPVNQYIRG